MVIDAGGRTGRGRPVARARHAVGVGGGAVVRARRHRQREIELPGPVSLAGFDADEAPTARRSCSSSRSRRPASLHEWTAERTASSAGALPRRPVDADASSTSSRSATRRPTASTCRCSSSAVATSHRRRHAVRAHGLRRASRSRRRPAYSPIAIAVAEAGGHVRGRLHPRRRRGRRGLAPCRHARAQAAGLRRLPRGGGLALSSGT